MKRKRASLPVARRAAPDTKPDLTDRLLEQHSVPAPAPQPAPRTRAVLETAPVLPELQPAAQAPQAKAVLETAPTFSELEPALQAARQAVEALVAARRTTPARYQLAVRWRLDALAHHLEQVVQFLAALPKK